MRMTLSETRRICAQKIVRRKLRLLDRKRSRQRRAETIAAIEELDRHRDLLNKMRLEFIQKQDELLDPRPNPQASTVLGLWSDWLS